VSIGTTITATPEVMALLTSMERSLRVIANNSARTAAAAETHMTVALRGVPMDDAMRLVNKFGKDIGLNGKI